MIARGTLLVALIVGALAADAQPGGRVPRIGFLNLLSQESDTRVPAFITGLRELGYVDGKTVAIEWRSAKGDTDRLPALAEELVRLRVDLIVAVQTQAIDAARRATKTIPIVFAATQDPVASGFAKTLSRPGGNITGITSLSAEMASKQIELLKALVPKLARVAILANPTNFASRPIRADIQKTAVAMGIVVASVSAAVPAEIEPAIGAAGAAKADALIVLGDSFLVQMRVPIAEAALKRRLPTIFVPRDHVFAGGLMSYGPNFSENYRRTAFFIDRILKGTKPGDLPIEQPSKFELVLNLKTAKALGITVPYSMLVRVDEVVR